MPSQIDDPRECILAFSTKGTGSNEEDRLKALVSGCPARILPYDKSHKIQSFWSLMRQLSRSRRRLVVMEGTGLAGGAACLLARLLFGHRYVVSSGDAVGPFVATHSRLFGLVFGIYERVLCRFCAGFIGWTPYLVGRAMTFGAPRGVTAAGWVIGSGVSDREGCRETVRRNWGVPADRIVFGIAGAIVWNKLRRYCYGSELVRAIRQVDRDDIAVVVIGDGSGLEKLKELAGDDLGKRVFLPGRVPLDEVMENLCGFDVASLPQSTDPVGAFRYTTKISEYRDASLPIVTSRIPAAYDLDRGDCWRLPGDSPWESTFIEALADLMRSVDRTSLDARLQQNRSQSDDTFEKQAQLDRVTKFLEDLLEDYEILPGGEPAAAVAKPSMA